LLERLGSGGFAEVYKAEDQKLGRVVALKMLPTSEHDGESPLIAEARAASRLSHPGIVGVHDVLKWNGRHCLVTELVEGESLAHRAARGPLPLDVAVAAAVGAAEALNAAHEAGIVHGDVHGANVLLAKDGRVKLADFGLARWRNDISRGEARLDGALAYSAPERLGGDPPDARSDVYSLGVVLYESLAGRRPFEAATAAELVKRILHEEPPPISRFRDDVPLDLESVVRTVLDKDPRRRYQSAAELLHGLQAVARQLSTGDRATPEASTGSARLAFRGLLPFQEADRAAFFGREADAQALFAKVTHTDFVFGVLYADSGTGKTSLLRAALVPLLWEGGFLPLYCRSGADPLARTLRECERRTRQPPHAGETALAYLARVAQRERSELVLVWDQFEEFLAGGGDADTLERHLEFLEGLLAGARGLRCLVAVRSDKLYLVGAQLGERVREPLAMRGLHHLRDLSLSQAKDVIERSARRARLELPAELIEQVAQDLVEGDSVRPSELQIVGERIESRRIGSLHDYRAAGGKDALVFSFVEDVLRSSGDARAAALLLGGLIGDGDERLALSAAELAERTQLSPLVIERTLSHVSGSRLVREVGESAPPRYELVHDSLVEKVQRATSRDTTYRANRLLAQHASAHAVDPGALVPLRHLRAIVKHADPRRRAAQRELLQRSLRRGLVRAGALTAGLIVAAVGVSAGLSITEEWPGVRLMDGHSAAVRHATFSPDGRRIVSAGEDGKVIVWDFARRERLRTLVEHRGWIPSVAFSPDGGRFATAGADGRVIVWNAARLEKEVELRGSGMPVTAAVFSPDGRMLAASEVERTILWAIDGWRKQAEIPKGEAWGAPVFSPDARRLYFPSHALAWDLRRERDEPGMALPTASWLALSPDGSKIVKGSGRGLVAFADTTGARPPRQHHPHRFHVRRPAFSPDGRLIATGAEDILLWDAATETRLARMSYRSEVWSLEFSPDGRFLLAGYQDGEMLLWDVAERDRVTSFREHQGPVSEVAFARDGRRFATAGADRTLRVWNAAGEIELTLEGHPSRIEAVSWTPDGQSLLSCDIIGTVTLWDIATRAPRWSRSTPGACYATAVSPDGRWAATSAGVFETATGRLAYGGEIVGPSPYGLAFSPDGRTLASSRDGTFLLIDVDRWTPRERHPQSDVRPIVVAFSPHAGFLLTGEDSGHVRLWQASPLRELQQLGRHASRVSSVAFSRDGRWAASSSEDQTVSVWDVERRSRAAQLGARTAPVLSVAFSGDGRLVTGEQDGAVRIFTRRRMLWGFALDPR
jgi:WD40 repeat protein